MIMIITMTTIIIINFASADHTDDGDHDDYGDHEDHDYGDHKDHD